MMPAEVSMFPCRKFAAPLMFGVCPNIQGQAAWSVGTEGSVAQGYGALSVEASGFKSVTMQDGEGDLSLGLNASAGNSIYSGTKLQPSAIQTLACIRI